MHRIHYDEHHGQTNPNLGSSPTVATALESLSDRNKRLWKRSVVKGIILEILIGEFLPITISNRL